MTSFALYTLGCKVNQEEGAAIISAMKKAGYEERPFNSEADIYIINTCTVTHVADSKSRRIISRAVRKNPDALIVVTGCYAQTNQEAVTALDGVDLICGNIEKSRITDLIADALQKKNTSSDAVVQVCDIMQVKDFVPLPEVAEQSRARAYLKIEDGCDRFCKYCIVPYARGPVRSLPMQKVVDEAQALIKNGHKEIVLSGIHVGAYGREQGTTLTALLQELLKLKGLKRIRLGSIEATQISDELLSLMKQEKKICRHLHIPLQSGCDKTLAAMGRDYDTSFFAALCERLRMLFLEIAITTDIMTGFPGETEEDFLQTCKFVERISFASAHIFPYSQRKGTPAATMPDQISVDIKNKRARILADITSASHQRFLESYIDKEIEILPETVSIENEKYYITGHTENFLPVICETDSFKSDDSLYCIVKCINNERLQAIALEK